jgi:hypothetical protein
MPQSSRLQYQFVSVVLASYFYIDIFNRTLLKSSVPISVVYLLSIILIVGSALLGTLRLGKGWPFFGLLGVWYLFSCIYSLDPFNGFEQVIGFSAVSLAALMIVGVLGKIKTTEHVMRHGFFAGVFYLLYCLVNYDSFFMQGFYGADLFFVGPEGHRSNAGRQVGYIGFFCLWMLLFSGGKAIRVIAAIGVLVSIYLILSSWTRNPFLVLLIPSLGYLVLKAKIKLLIIICIGCLALFGLLAFSEIIGIDLYVVYMTERGTSGRYDLILYLINGVATQGAELYGLGIGSLDLINKENYDLLSRDTFHLVATYYETGIIGTILWLSLICCSLLTLFFTRNRIPNATLFALCLVIYGFVNPSEAILVNFSGLITFNIYLFIVASLTPSSYFNPNIKSSALTNAN